MRRLLLIDRLRALRPCFNRDWDQGVLLLEVDLEGALQFDKFVVVLEFILKFETLFEFLAVVTLQACDEES